MLYYLPIAGGRIIGFQLGYLHEQNNKIKSQRKRKEKNEKLTWGTKTIRYKSVAFCVAILIALWNSLPLSKMLTSPHVHWSACWHWQHHCWLTNTLGPSRLHFWSQSFMWVHLFVHLCTKTHTSNLQRNLPQTLSKDAGFRLLSTNIDRDTHPYIYINHTKMWEQVLHCPHQPPARGDSTVYISHEYTFLSIWCYNWRLNLPVNIYLADSLKVYLYLKYLVILIQTL